MQLDRDAYGKPAAIVVLAICAFFAFAPAHWIAALLPLPWTDTALILSRIIFLVIGGGAAVALWRYYKAVKPD